MKRAQFVRELGERLRSDDASAWDRHSGDVAVALADDHDALLRAAIAVADAGGYDAAMEQKIDALRAVVRRLR